MSDPYEITQLLLSISNGNQDAYNDLLPLVYDELKNIASRQLGSEYFEHTLSKTDLVHELFLKLVDQTRIHYNDRVHFYAIAARSMRQLLVDYARKKKATKRGGGIKNIALDENIIHMQKHADQILDLDQYLTELSNIDERMVKIVELRFFAGLNIDDTAEMLNLSVSTVNREWTKARGFLHQRIKSE